MAILNDHSDCFSKRTKPISRVFIVIERLQAINAELEQKRLFIDEQFITIKNKLYGKSSEREPNTDLCFSGISAWGAPEGTPEIERTNGLAEGCWEIVARITDLDPFAKCKNVST